MKQHHQQDLVSCLWWVSLTETVSTTDQLRLSTETKHVLHGINLYVT